MNRLLAILLVAAVLVDPVRGAQPGPAPKPAPKGQRAPRFPDRYLFVIEASSAMAKHRAIIQQTVAGLVLGGMNGELRGGEQLRIYTFADTVKTETFTMQVWAPMVAQGQAAVAAEFIQKLRFEKRPRIEKAIDEIITAVRASEKITIFLITDGTQPILGTPFDAEINALFGDHREALRRAKTVFVTAFVASKGKILAWSMAAAGARIPIPKPPPEPAPGGPAVPSADPSPGKTETPPASSSPKPEPLPAKPAIEPGTAPREGIAVDPKPERAIERATVRKPESVPAIPPASGPDTPLLPVQPVPTESRARITPDIPPAPRPEPESPPPAKVGSGPSVTGPTDLPPARETVAPTPAAVPVEKAPEPSKPTAPALLQPATLPTVVASQSPESTPAKPTAEQATPPIVRDSGVEGRPAATNVEGKTQAQTAVVSPPGTGPGSRRLLLVAGLFLLVAGAFGVLWLRRAQTVSRPSLITQSFHQDEKR